MANECRNPWIEDVGGIPIGGCDGTTLKLVFATTMGTGTMYVCGCTTYCPKFCPRQGDQLFSASFFNAGDVLAACDDGSTAPDAGATCTATGNACFSSSDCCQGHCEPAHLLPPMLGTCAP